MPIKKNGENRELRDSTMRFRLHALFALPLILTGSALYAGELDGRWRHGTWNDTKSGHEDALRGRFRQKDDGDYRVVFTGRFAKIVPFRFATTLKVVGNDGDKVILAGESRVAGIMRFSYRGVADGGNFDAQYHSRRWTGEFHLQR
jgi:hypothetical protein